MTKMRWVWNRLKAMNAAEIAWRVSQKLLQREEKRRFGLQKQAVTSRVFNPKLASLRMNAKRMHLNAQNRLYATTADIPLLGGYHYQNYQKQWNAGFQTNHVWPMAFSYEIEYKQRDDIGDARTNWELNRHYQFAILAKNYAATGKESYLSKLQELFADWNTKNPFLWGISWTSVMEAAIRTSNWCYTYCFLELADSKPEPLMEQLRIGIVNMTDHIIRHYSRYSSANNHLIVEAYAIGQSGVLLDYQPWTDLAVQILTRELPVQNYPDGVNKELSLHYQSFYMEAMGLMLRLLKQNGQAVPETWEPMLMKMARYLANCRGTYGETIEFGDNDEGKILDLSGGVEHYPYVLGLLGCLLPERYSPLAADKICENLRWLFTSDTLAAVEQKPEYIPDGSCCFREGGNTILRSKDARVLIGIDHAALGFGSIAAHGHADALSFQMFVDGKPLFIDPGTSAYHCSLTKRNVFRKTENHSTVCIGGNDQSEMLGSFLWGRKAACNLLETEFNEDYDLIRAEHTGYAPDMHRREWKLFRDGRVEIRDAIVTDQPWSLSFILSPEAAKYAQIEPDHSLRVHRPSIRVSWETKTQITSELLPVMVSRAYGIETASQKLVLSGTGSATVETQIREI